jgi:hypothetical protein
VTDAGLLVASGFIHLHLRDIAYQHVPALNVLFPIQAAAPVVAALMLLVTRHVIVEASAVVLHGRDEAVPVTGDQETGEHKAPHVGGNRYCRAVLRRARG